MSTYDQRQHAIDVLFGKASPDLSGFAHVPAVLRYREARRAAIAVLAEQSPLTSLESAALLRAVGCESDPHVRVAALQALAKVGETQLSVPVLLASSMDPHELVQQAAQRELRRFVGEGLPERVVLRSRARMQKPTPQDERVPEIF